MDKGEFIKNGYSVEPGDGGSWVVHSTRRDTGLWSEKRGFSNFVDLTRWLTEEHVVLDKGPNPFDPKQATEHHHG